MEEAYSIAYPFHALARIHAKKHGRIDGGTPLVRLLDERAGFMSPDGCHVLECAIRTCFQESCQLLDIVAHEGAVPRAELELFADLLGSAQSTPEDVLTVTTLRIRYDLTKPVVMDEVQNTLDFAATASTSAKAIKLLAEHVSEAPRDEMTRVNAMRFLHMRLVDLAIGKLTGLASALESFTPLLKDPHPVVRDLMWTNADAIAKRLFDYELSASAALCRRYVHQVVQRGMDLDLNLARLSILCEMAGETDAARDARARLERLLGDDAQASELIRAITPRSLRAGRRAARNK